MCDDDWSTVLESTHEAVCTYARAEFEALTRKVIHRLRGAKASGVFGDD
jgi:hypothetical protein